MIPMLVHEVDAPNDVKVDVVPLRHHLVVEVDVNHRVMVVVPERDKMEVVRLDNEYGLSACNI